MRFEINLFKNRNNLIDILNDFGRTQEFAAVEPYTAKSLVFT